MITIKNLRKDGRPTEPWQVKVDRGTPLGNPYYLQGEQNRDKLCNAYELHFHYNNKHYEKELNRLLSLHKTHGRLELWCWCVPKRCHAETIKKWLEEHI